MKTFVITYSIVVFGALSNSGQTLPPAGTAAWTNTLRAKSIAEQQAWITARQEAEAGRSSGQGVTNGMAQLAAVADTVKREIRPVQGGAIADYGRMQVQFPTDVVEPLTITTPQGKTLSCRASRVVLYSPSKDQTYVLGVLTNSLGTIVAPNAVVYSNAFQSFPGAHLRYEYDAIKGSLTQFLVLETQPEWPEPLSPDDGAIEVWTVWSGAEPLSSESHQVGFRDVAVDGTAVEATDTTVDFGTMRIVGDGKAFNLQNPGDKIAVAKAWNPQAAKGGSAGGAVLIESVDWRSFAPKLRDLPKVARPKTASISRESREVQLAKLSVQSSGLSGSRSGAEASRQQTSVVTGASKVNRQTSSGKSSVPMLLVSARQRPMQAAVIDFTIVCSVAVPADAISWWPAGGNASDAVGSNQGYLTNGTTYAAGEVGQGFSFDGVNDYMAVPRSSSLNPGNQVTIEFWMRADADNPMNSLQGLVTTPYYEIEISNGLQDRYGVNFALTTDGGQYFAMTSEAGTNGGGAPVSAGVWHHVAGTYDGSQMQLYIDGQSWGQAMAQSGSISSMAANTFLAIGSEDGRGDPNCVGTRYFKGRIDEATIYSRALSASEIQDLYNAGGAGKHNPSCVSPSTNAVAWWPGDGNVYDLARTNVATLKNGATFIGGRVAGAFDLNNDGGSDDSVEVPQNSAWAFGSSDFTIEFWANFRSWSPLALDYPEAIFLGADQGGGNQNKWFFASGGSQLNFHANSPTLGAQFLVRSAFYPNANSWYHLAVTRSGTTLTIYTNGVVAGTAPINFSIPSVNAPLTIGQAEGIGYVKGLLDEVTIYSRALSGTEIGAIYSAGGAGKCKVDSDSDGLTDLQEPFLGTDPNSADSNGDGLKDGDEVFIYHTDPLRARFRVRITRPGSNANLP